MLQPHPYGRRAGHIAFLSPTTKHRSSPPLTQLLSRLGRTQMTGRALSIGLLLASAVALWGCDSRRLHPQDAANALSLDSGPPADRFMLPDAVADFPVDLAPKPEPSWPPEFGAPLCNATGWCWDAPQPFGGEVRTVWASGRDDVYIAHSRLLLHYDGQAWTQVDLSTPLGLANQHVSLVALWGSTKSDVYVLAQSGDSSYIARFDGKRWRKDLTVAGKLVAISGWSEQSLVAIGLNLPGYARAIWERSTKGWTQRASFGTAYSFSKVFARSASDIFIAASTMSTGEELLLHFDGLALREIALPSASRISAIWGESSSLYVAASQDNWPPAAVLYRYDRSGWHELLLSADDTFATVWGRSANDLYAFELNGGVNHFDGKAWARDARYAHTRAGLSLVSSVCAVGEQLLAAGGLGRVWIEDAGQWQVLAPQIEGILGVAQLWAAGANEIYGIAGKRLWRFDGKAWALAGSVPAEARALAGRAQELLLLTKDALMKRQGANWVQLSSGPFDDASAIWIADAQHLYVGTKPANDSSSDGAVWARDGAKWTEYKLIIGAIQALWAASPEAVYAAGDKGVAFFDGASWQQVHSWNADFSPKADIWGTSAKNVVAIASTGQLAHFDGKAWSEQSMPFSLTGVDGSGDEIFVSYGGGVLRFDGTSWQDEDLGTDQSLYDIAVTPTQVVVVGNGGLAMSRRR